MLTSNINVSLNLTSTVQIPEDLLVDRDRRCHNLKLISFVSLTDMQNLTLKTQFVKKKFICL